MSISEPSEVLSKVQRGNVLWLTITRPARRNALNNTLIQALTSAFADAETNPDLRAIVLTGQGDKAFCAGADLDPQAKTFGFDYSQPRTHYAEFLRRAYQARVPVVGRINGHCLAGGMGLLGICDMAVATRSAGFGLPEVKVGMFPMQVAAVLQAIVPPRLFAEMCFTGEMIDADAACAAGLINYVAEPEDLDSKLAWLLERVINKSPAAIRRGKYALRAIQSMPFEQAIAFMEGQLGLMPMTEDAREGLEAFAQKRPPRWTGA